MKIIQKLQKKFYPRGKIIARIILPFIKDNDKILDFGCGNGKIAENIQKIKSVEIIGIDNINYNLSNIKFIKYSGGKLPFKDKNFDVVLSIFVLHHTDNPEFYIKELARVSKKKIIIFEDVYNTRIGKTLLNWWDNLNKIVSNEINCPFNFKTNAEWIEQFNINNLSLIKTKRVFISSLSFLKTMRMYVLEKSASNY